MKRLLVFLAVVAVGALSGCASSGASMASTHRVKQVDAAYVARVETIARSRGVKVSWVNPPQIEAPVVAQQD